MLPKNRTGAHSGYVLPTSRGVTQNPDGTPRIKWDGLALQTLTCYWCFNSFFSISHGEPAGFVIMEDGDRQRIRSFVPCPTCGASTERRFETEGLDAPAELSTAQRRELAVAFMRAPDGQGLAAAYAALSSLLESAEDPAKAVQTAAEAITVAIETGDASAAAAFAPLAAFFRAISFPDLSSEAKNYILAALLALLTIAHDRILAADAVAAADASDQRAEAFQQRLLELEERQAEALERLCAAPEATGDAPVVGGPDLSVPPAKDGEDDDRLSKKGGEDNVGGERQEQAADRPQEGEGLREVHADEDTTDAARPAPVVSADTPDRDDS